eukprot:1741725-Pyramimonas_sp.AAC.1
MPGGSCNASNAGIALMSTMVVANPQPATTPLVTWSGPTTTPPREMNLPCRYPCTASRANWTGNSY